MCIAKVSKIYAYLILYCVMKRTIVRDLDKRVELPQRCKRCSWLRKLWILSTVDRVFFILLLYILYFGIGKCTSKYTSKLLKLI